MASEEEGEKASNKIQNKIFIPSLVLAFAAVLVAMVLTNFKNSSQFAIGVGAIAAIIAAFVITKAKPKEAVNDGARLLHQMGPTSMLPQLLVALGALFTQAGVGEVISKYISGVVPADNRFFAVIVGALALTAGYCGTLLTPMAANFNIVPSALLECKNQYEVIKYQAPTAIILLVVHVFAMYFLAF